MLRLGYYGEYSVARACPCQRGSPFVTRVVLVLDGGCVKTVFARWNFGSFGGEIAPCNIVESEG